MEEDVANGTGSRSGMIRYALLFLAIFVAGAMLRREQEVLALRNLVHGQEETIVELQKWTMRAARQFELLGRHKIPYRYLEILAGACEENNVNLEFMVALMQVESNFDPHAKSHKDAYGLMQLLFPTAKEIDTELQDPVQLFEPELNIRLGVTYFRNMLDRYNGDYCLAALAYNRGPNRLDRELVSSPDPIYRYYQMILAARVNE